ncbi:MAG: hypothetical protein HQL23_06355 [Candidatus Omnitrophica bacterium]|nr:hypothetical protein [Candidatus Omnitrophota bacterium]
MNHSLRRLLSCYDLPRPVDWTAVFKRQAPLVVEIGFGLGEILCRNALANPGSDYVGIELH